MLWEVSEEHRGKDLNELDLDRDSLPSERALGLQWRIMNDAFQFKILVKERSYARRGMLSLVISVYDPLGFIAKITLRGKVLLQELCRRRCGRDDNLPYDIQQHWMKKFSRFQNPKLGGILNQIILDDPYLPNFIISLIQVDVVLKVM